MEYKKFGNKYIVRVDKGEEIVEKLTELAETEDISLANVSGIGATNKCTIGLFAVEEKKYHSKEYTGDFEIAPLTGNISTMNGKKYLHLHINIGDKDNKSFSGHLNSAIVSATFECIIDVIEGNIDREKNEEIGLNLIKFE